MPETAAGTALGLAEVELPGDAALRAAVEEAGYEFAG